MSKKYLILGVVTMLSLSCVTTEAFAQRWKKRKRPGNQNQGQWQNRLNNPEAREARRKKMQERMQQNPELREKWLKRMQQRGQGSEISQERRMGQRGMEMGQGQGLDREQRRQQMQERWNKLRETNPAFKGLNDRFKALREAKQSGDRETMKQRIKDLHEYYQGMDSQARENFRQQMPDIARIFERRPGMQRPEGQPMRMQGNWSGPQGRQGNFQGMRQREGNTITGNRTWTNEQGKQKTLDRTTTFEGNTRTTTSEWTNPAGKTKSVTETAVRAGNTVDKSRTVTGYNGNTHTSTGQTTHSKDGSSATWTSQDGDEYSNDWMLEVLGED